MKILLLAPQPFYTERGTPIAVRILAQTLCDLGHRVDLLVYPEGEDVDHPGLRLLRAMRLPGLGPVPIGFSWKKVAQDLTLAGTAIRRMVRNRYDVVHAVEESVYIALATRPIHRARVVYDMDSSMADQLCQKSPLLARFGRLLHGAERWALRRADGVLAVCRDLVDRAEAAAPHGPVALLEDVALESWGNGDREGGAEDLRTHVRQDRPLVLYVGNLEPYQGVDLAVEALAAAGAPADLVVIGGDREGIGRLRRFAGALGVGEAVHLLGPRPVADLMAYLRQADILLSPRAEGNNTPMKLYSYLAAARPVLATDIRSHTQVLDDRTALLVPPEPAAMGAALRRLAEDAALRASLGQAAGELAAERFGMARFRQRLERFYSQLESAH